MADDNTTGLPQEAKIVTSELLHDALKCFGDTIRVMSFDVRPAAKQGENFSSVVLFVSVKASIDGAGDEEFELFLKTCYAVDFCRELLISRGDFFEREKQAYVGILPSLVNYQLDKGVLEPAVFPVPKFVYGKTDYENKTAVLFLENLVSQGYKKVSPLTGLDFEHCQIALKEMAHLHAISYAMKNGNADNLRAVFGDTPFKYAQFSSLFADIQKQPFKDSIIQVVTQLKSHTKDQGVLTRLEAFLEKDHYAIVKDCFTNPKEPYCGLCHGDTWCSNMLFKYVGDGKPETVKFCDLQVLRYGNFSVELAYTLYMSCSAAFRKARLRDLLGVYHGHFHETLRSVGFKAPGFTLEVLEQQFRECATFGFLLGSSATLVLFANPEVVVTAGQGERTDTWVDVKPEDVSQHAKERILKRLLEFLDEAMENGVL